VEANQKEMKPKLTAERAYKYFENLKAEFQKIQWTEGEEVKVYAKVVVGATFVLGLAIYFADLIIHRVMFGLEAIYRFLFG